MKKIIEWFSDQFYNLNRFRKYVRNKFWRKHNTIKIKSLDEQWHDKDELIIHVMFQILNNYIEIELKETPIDWTWNEEHKQAWIELQSLYQWWNHIRPLREAQDPIFYVDPPPMSWKERPDGLLELLDPPDNEQTRLWKMACEESSALELKWNEEDTENMVKLVKMRKFLWT